MAVVFVVGILAVLPYVIYLLLPQNNQLILAGLYSGISLLFFTIYVIITSKVKISGFTGRGSISQVSRQIYTKFYNGQIRHISARTFGKLVAYEAGYSVLNVFINIFINTVRHYKQYNK